MNHFNPHIAAAAAPLAIDIRGLSRHFGERAVLDRIDLQVRAGEFVALLGRSGSGKSTLLRVLSGFDADVTGQVRVAERRAIVFQEPRLFPWARVLANVGTGLPRAVAREKGRAMLAEVGLADKGNAWPLTLSGGEAQRVALARALIRDPQLLMLDEPFGALDALTRIRMHELLRRLCARHRPTVFMVTHDVDEAIALADRVLILDRGRIGLDQPVHLSGDAERDAAARVRYRELFLKHLGID